MPTYRILLFFLTILFFAGPTQAQIALRADTVYTMAGPPILDGVVLVRDGQIERVGPAAEVTVPDGYEARRGSVVTPGLIDAHSVVGLAGIYNTEHDQDQLDTSDPIQPELRALDAYNPRERLVQWLRDHGVTTVHTGHGPGALVSGQTMIVKTHGATLQEALVDSVTMVAMTLGNSVERNFDSPGTSAKSVAMLRDQLVKAQDYRAKMDGPADERPPRDLKMETLAQVVGGDVPVLMTAQRATDITAALRLAREFDLDLVLDGAAESYLVLDEIREANVPVVLHPTMVRTSGDTENAAYTTAAKLHEAGIPFTFQSGYEGYVPKTRVVLFEAAIAAANGLDREVALETLTTEAAALLGLQERIGSLEPGKEADVVLFDGDPFEYTTRVCTVVLGGEIVSDTCR